MLIVHRLRQSTPRLRCGAHEAGGAGPDEEHTQGAGRQPDYRRPARRARNDHGLPRISRTVIESAEAMSVTFPTFVELMKSLGARIEIERDD